MNEGIQRAGRPPHNRMVDLEDGRAPVVVFNSFFSTWRSKYFLLVMSRGEHGASHLGKHHIFQAKYAQNVLQHILFFGTINVVEIPAENFIKMNSLKIKIPSILH